MYGNNSNPAFVQKLPYNNKNLSNHNLRKAWNVQRPRFDGLRPKSLRMTRPGKPGQTPQWGKPSRRPIEFGRPTQEFEEEPVVIPNYDLPTQPNIQPYDPPKNVKVGVTHPRGILHEIHSQHKELFPIVPEFQMVGQDGPSHRMHFTVRCEYGLEMNRIHTQATASSKKDAKLKAASKMVDKLKSLNIKITIAPKCPKSSQNAIQDLKVNHMHPRGRLHEMHSTDCELFPRQPEFELEAATGPPHNRIFTIRCKFSVKVGGEIKELTSTATAESKKRAMLKASKEMLEQLKLIQEVKEWVDDIANSSPEFVPGKWFCKHCNTYMTGSQPFIAHLRGKQHLKKIHKLKLDEKEVMIEMWQRAYGDKEIPEAMLRLGCEKGPLRRPFGAWTEQAECVLGSEFDHPREVMAPVIARAWSWPEHLSLDYTMKSFFELTEKLSPEEQQIITEFEVLDSKNCFIEGVDPGILSIDALKSLLPKQHMSHAVVDMFFRLLQHKYKDRQIVFYDSAFFQYLATGGLPRVYSYTTEATLQRLAGIKCITEARAVIFPIYFSHKKQWMTCCLRPRPYAEYGSNGLEIALYNSNAQWCDEEAQLVCAHIRSFAQNEQYKAGTLPTPFWGWVYPKMHTLPQQRHEMDSGVFAIAFAQCIAAGEDFTKIPSNVHMKKVARSRAFLSLLKRLSTGGGGNQWFFGDRE